MNHAHIIKSPKWFFRLVFGMTLFFPLIVMDQPASAREHQPVANEQKTAQLLETYRDHPGLLYAFLRQMPKGGDLHNHLSGAIYAESMIRWAADDGLCIDKGSFQATAPPCDAQAGRLEAKQVIQDETLYRKTIDAWSMRNWQFSGQSGHDHFFDTFQKFDITTDKRQGDMLAEVTNRGAAGRVSYLELMITPEGHTLAGLATRSGWNDDFSRMRSRLESEGIADILQTISKMTDQSEAIKNSRLRCDSQQAEPGCNVTIRFLYQVLRGLPKEIVFAQMLAGFKLAAADHRFVGLNLVMPEDHQISMADYQLHMKMLDYLHSVYPQVKLTLHGGELAPGLVPPEGLRFHIRDAVRQAHAKRIGHGVDIMYEDDSQALLQEMARNGILVEILLTSNDVILGVKGKEHPLNSYIRYGVPVALATDDEGVSRSEMPREFQLAVTDQGLGYLQLKKMTRNSLEYSFIEGASIWSDRQYRQITPACAKDKPAIKPLSATCERFLAKNSKARLQWKLEQDLANFEAKAAGSGNQFQ